MMPYHNRFHRWLLEVDACDSGRRYAATFPTILDAWRGCESWFYMRWLLNVLRFNDKAMDRALWTPLGNHRCTSAVRRRVSEELLLAKFEDSCEALGVEP